MSGEIIALVSAACFGLSGAAIAKGAEHGRRGDNGAFLSILFTAALAGLLWAAMGEADLGALDAGPLLLAIGWFVLAGILATVLGRLAMFRSVELAGAITASLFRRLVPVFAGILGFLLLGETIGLVAAIGMAVIMGSVLAVMRTSLGAALGGTAADAAAHRRGQALGAASAGLYGGAYVTRKLGLMHVADPAFGAFVGAVTGIIWYALRAPFSSATRAMLNGMIGNTGRWQVLAAASMSLGQTLQFFALARADVAAVAVIGALEVFVSIYLAAYVFRTEPPPGLGVTLAALAACGGVALVAFG